MVLSLLAAGILFPDLLSGSSGFVYAVVLTGVALGLVFSGRSVIKGLAFLVAGLAGATLGLSLGSAALGVIGAIAGGVVGFLVGGVIGVWLVEVGMGLALGYFGYLAAHYLTGSLLLAVAVGVVLFFVGLALSSKLLELATAALGGLILYSVLIYFGAAPLAALVVSLVIAAAGFFVQQRNRRRGERRGQT
jgi:hypothetical protein